MVKTRQPVGRAELLAQARSALATGQSVLLRGPAGVGKSTVLDALALRPRAAVVLRSAAAEAEAELPYLGLIDLLDGASEAAFGTLPEHLRAAIDGALLRTALPETPYDQLAVRLAVLELLRALAADRSVLLIVDDLQWIDEPSAEVLRFVARRLEGTSIRLLAAERFAGDADPSRADLCPQPCVQLTVSPLSESDVVDLLRERFGGSVTRRDAQRIYRASRGNPLYVTELGRALRARTTPVAPMEPLPVPDKLRALLSARIATLPESERPILLLTAAAARPSVALLERCGVSVGRGLEAVRTGMLVVEPDGAIRFTHPLLCEMVYADAPAPERASAHERLAEVATDPVERSRHLAAARDAPDETLARSLAEAADAARLRGAPAAAA
ncbi:MAG: AAA family ATPase, partial [Dactylosporangium sp.]|nr:AAA family ATPase [Dactylosporangium sp.]NNJ60547.1 AAA family ATPase [Dactylosporangium sp.]